MLNDLKTKIAAGKEFKITVIVTPRSQQNKVISCWLDPKTSEFTLKVKVRGIPENGQVNENLINYLSTELNLAKSSLQIISGFTSRQKILSINALQ